MDNKKVDFIVYEASMNRLERTNKRLFNLNIILVVILFLTIAGVLCYSMIPSDYNSQNVDSIDSVNNSTIRNGN